MIAESAPEAGAPRRPRARDPRLAGVAFLPAEPSAADLLVSRLAVEGTSAQSGEDLLGVSVSGSLAEGREISAGSASPGGRRGGWDVRAQALEAAVGDG